MDECCSALEDLIEYEHVSVNDMLSWGIYPICVAVRLRSPALVRLMLDKGADPNVMDSWNETPLSLSIMLQHPEIIHLLVAAKANVNHMGSITGKCVKIAISFNIKKKKFMQIHILWIISLRYAQFT